MPTVVSFIVSAVVGILPVLVLLAVLQFLDSFKLVRLRVILWTIGAGAITGLLAYQVNGFILSVAEMEFSTYSRYIAPVVEEILKASIVLFLFKTHRAGFLVDAAILGFSVGAGFAVIENIYYLFNSDANLSAEAHDGESRVAGRRRVSLGVQSLFLFARDVFICGFCIVAAIHDAGVRQEQSNPY
jgi:RsiW-degrading membrane proteinase PrsW (M82 family)